MEECKMIITIIGLLIGLLILGGGIYYLNANKEDDESRKIYGITILVGVIITVVFVIKLVISIL
jgi:hypothetical protein